MASFYMIYIIPRPSVTAARVQARMNLAVDWFRLGGTLWIVYTTSDASKWHERLSPLVGKAEGALFICRLDPRDRQGWITKKLWDWFNKHGVTKG
jgi:hypothetical protein